MRKSSSANEPHIAMLAGGSFSPEKQFHMRLREEFTARNIAFRYHRDCQKSHQAALPIPNDVDLVLVLVDVVKRGSESSIIEQCKKAGVDVIRCQHTAPRVIEALDRCGYPRRAPPEPADKPLAPLTPPAPPKPGNVTLFNRPNAVVHVAPPEPPMPTPVPVPAEVPLTLDPTRMALAQLVRRLRAELGMSVEQFARLLDVTGSAVDFWEAGGIRLPVYGTRRQLEILDAGLRKGLKGGPLQDHLNEESAKILCGADILYLRLSVGATHEEFARLLNYEAPDAHSMGRWERGASVPWGSPREDSQRFFARVAAQLTYPEADAVFLTSTNITALRAALKMTQDEFAILFGVPKGVVIGWETRGRIPAAHDARRLTGMIRLMKEDKLKVRAPAPVQAPFAMKDDGTKVTPPKKVESVAEPVKEAPKPVAKVVRATEPGKAAPVAVSTGTPWGLDPALAPAVAALVRSLDVPTERVLEAVDALRKKELTALRALGAVSPSVDTYVKWLEGRLDELETAAREILLATTLNGTRQK